MPRKNEHDFLMKVLCGNASAVDFCEVLFRISQVLDDLYDGDKQVDREHLVDVLGWESLIRLPNNPFYIQYFHVLNPIMQAAIVDWMDANKLERGRDHEKNIAFVLRDSIGGIISHCALLVGGYAWMREWSPKIRQHIFEEPLKDYKRELSI